ncbi:actin [Tritrichomonas musculus]|uniref:Actin n=1 Tax=Tritrichomonas musculus TaxID=1915356 RepID=A0ABR2JET8_9EUKA
MSSELQSIIIDNGSCVLKCGFAGEPSPHRIFTDAIGYPRFPVVVQQGTHKDFYVSNDAKEKSGVIDLEYPIRHGIIKDWEKMDKIWHHTLYKELRIDPTEHPIFFTYNFNVPDTQNQKIAEIMFEKYNFPAIYFQPSNKLVLLACEKTSGIVLESGDGVTSISAIYDNFVVKQSVKFTKIAGSTLTNYLISKLNKNKIRFRNSSDMLYAREIKEKLCYVAQDYDQELKNVASNSNAKEMDNKYADGSIKLTDLRFKVPEFMFHPHVLGLDATGIQTMLGESIQACDSHMQPELLKNICLAGGNTMFEGFSQRIENEIKKLFPNNDQISTVTTKQRGSEAWLGGSILCQHESLLNKIIPKNVFNEEGPTVISRRCQ